MSGHQNKQNKINSKKKRGYEVWTNIIDAVLDKKSLTNEKRHQKYYQGKKKRKLRSN